MTARVSAMNISAVLLAAGESRRFGDANKLALRINGKPLLRRVAQTLARANLAEVVVVLGYEAETSRPLLAGVSVRIAVNKDYAQGQMSSVCCGIRALRRKNTAVMVCLSDQPLLDTRDINRLAARFIARPTAALVPTYQGKRGNPVILAVEQRAAILNGGANLGCRHFIENNPGLVDTYEFDNDHVVFDIDTPDDCKRLPRAQTARGAL